MYEPQKCEDRHVTIARQAGEDHCDPTSKCFECARGLNTANCDLCPDNPNPDPKYEVYRLIVWLQESLEVIETANNERVTLDLPLDDKRFQSQIKKALTDFNDYGERMFSLLYLNPYMTPERLHRHANAERLANCIFKKRG